MEIMSAYANYSKINKKIYLVICNDVFPSEKAAVHIYTWEKIAYFKQLYYSVLIHSKQLVAETSATNFIYHCIVLVI